jgi:hypothetical protein
MRPGGVGLACVNKKTGEMTGYTPQGMSAEGIVAIPGARRCWVSSEQVKQYIQKKG